MRVINKSNQYARRVVSIVRSEGVISLAIKSLQKIQKRRAKTTDNPNLKQKYNSLVDRRSVMDADWANAPYKDVKRKASAPYTINWVMSPPAGGGGHQNIFRFIEHLDMLGHKNNIYLYSTMDKTTPEQAKVNVSSYCSAKNLTFQRLGKKVAKADAVFATGWETAYPVFNMNTDAKKLYFVQDFEPYFYPIGTDYVLAENTYKFGFHGITAGGFLKEKLSKEYGMKCSSYDFAADQNNYRYTKTDKRKEIFFYARPVTERRGFDLGIMVLELFHKARPDYVINLAGWDVSGYDIPFPYVNHKALKISELSGLYNECAAALVLSLTNMSLLPPELLACGVIPVVNEGKNNRLVCDNKYIEYVDASPAAMAQRLVETVDRPDLLKHSEAASRSISTAGWSKSKDDFMEILAKELSGE